MRFEPPITHVRTRRASGTPRAWSSWLSPTGLVSQLVWWSWAGFGWENSEMFCFFQFVLYHDFFYIYWYGYSYIQIKVLNVLSHEKHRGLGFVDWHWKSHITLPGSSLGVSTDLTSVYGWLSGCPVRHGDRWTPISDLAAQVCWHPKHKQIRLGSRRSTTPWPTTPRITRTHRHFGGVAGASRITDRGAPPEKLGMSR